VAHLDPSELVEQSVVDTYAADGVVMLPGALSSEWIDVLRSGMAQNLASPSDRGRFWDRDAGGRTTFYDSQSWMQNEHYRRFVEDSPMAEIAGRVMGVGAVNFFFDAVFVRSPGSRFRTPFHQDEPYWSVSGFDTCSVWTPLCPVRKVSALEFVRGSHRWPHTYRQQNFGALTGDDRDHVVFGDDTVPFPDIEGDRASYEILSWEMQPGDIAIFNARMIHGGSGNLPDGVDLQVFNTQWLGDDVRVIFRDEGMDPDHSEVMTAAGLRPGDRVGGVLYPEVWRADTARTP